jgi:hypothetical protein
MITCKSNPNVAPRPRKTESSRPCFVELLSSNSSRRMQAFPQKRWPSSHVASARRWPESKDCSAQQLLFGLKIDLRMQVNKRKGGTPNLAGIGGTELPGARNIDAILRDTLGSLTPMQQLFARILHECPGCQSRRVRRAKRKGFLERTLYRALIIWPYRCQDCDLRFLDFHSQKEAPSHSSVT